MKKIVTLATALVLGLGSLQAQTSELPARKTTFAKDKATDHLFFEIGDAAAINFGGKNSDASFSDRLTFVNPNVAFGKWYNPYFATRLQLQVGKLNDYDYIVATKTLQSKIFQTNYNYGVGHLDFMFDAINFFTPYRQNRFFHVIPYVGVGLGYNWDRFNKTGIQVLADEHSVHFTPLVDAGVQFKFNLCKRVDLNLEGQVFASDLRFRSQLNGGVTGSVGLGLTYHIGKKEFTPIVEEDEALIRQLNNQLNALRVENTELRKRPEHCPEVAPATMAKGIAVGNVVYFRLNSDKVDANQLINIYNIAEYAKNNTEVITLVGYADRQTGTPDYNFNLSERRAKAVAKILVEKYGISADRIRTSWEGDKVQPYNLNEWNRVVIMSAAE